MANKTINDLPTKSGPLDGTEWAEIDDGSSKKVTLQQIADLASGGGSSRDAVTVLSIVSGVVDVDVSAGDYFTLSLTANVTSLTFSNLPASGHGVTLMFRIRQDATGSRSFALPSSFKAVTGSDTSVQSAANAYTILAITSFDQGTRWEYSMKAGAA